MARKNILPPPKPSDNGSADLTPAAAAPGGPSKPEDALADFAPAEPPPAAGVPAPEDELSSYRSAAQVEAGERPPARITTLQVRKPIDQEYVRVMPGGGRVLPLFKSKADGDRLYLFKHEVEPYLPAKAVRPYRLVLA